MLPLHLNLQELKEIQLTSKKSLEDSQHVQHNKAAALEVLKRAQQMVSTSQVFRTTIVTRTIES